MKTILWWLIAGSKGGINRARIIEALHGRPYNANQLTVMLGLDYKTIRHHLKVLVDNRIIESNTGEKYGTMYFLSTEMEGNYNLFIEIYSKFRDKPTMVKREE
ncbi:MAG: winged helix-turn-helix domain-containing protein [Methanomassiliicoccales archaeon]|nr:winged helix-turn-helix domain-containing protein [Methanomassiliicoccales archaeon]